MSYKNREDYNKWLREDYKKHIEERRQKSRDYRARQPKKVKPKEKTLAEKRRSYRNWRYKRLYGINLEEYEELYRQQNGLCAICERPPGIESHLCVDHDHDTGRVRGLLCKPCNSAIGYFQDNQKLLSKATDYLKRSM